jgi:hypothetical protein
MILFRKHYKRPQAESTLEKSDQLHVIVVGHFYLDKLEFNVGIL